MRKFVLVLTLASLLVLTVAGTAFAANHFFAFDGSLAKSDRTMEITASNCADCHAGSVGHTAGPHGGYADATDKCQACHDVHGKGENAALLMGVTVTGACQYCHDLTATWAGPYNMNALAKVGSAHKVVGIDVYAYTDSEGQPNEPTTGVTIIPGGNGADGSEGTPANGYGIKNTKNAYTGKDPILSGQVFTCNSCHTPHGVKTVQPYIGESFVKFFNYDPVDGGDGTEARLYMTSRILKQLPNSIGVAEVVYKYNSKWCLACHQGRDDLDIEEIHNHPVNEDQMAYQLLEIALGKATADTLLARGNDDSPLDGDTILNNSPEDYANNYITFGTKAGLDMTTDPRKNTQFVMTPGDFMNANAPRTDYDGFDAIDGPDGAGGYKYVDKGPACQQCHGSARDADQTWEFNFDPNSNANGPYRASFPHISQNKALLVEEADDFCTNCHDPNILP